MAERIGDHDLEALGLAGSARVALDDDIDEAIRLLRSAVEVTDPTSDGWGRPARCTYWVSRCRWGVTSKGPGT